LKYYSVFKCWGHHHSTLAYLVPTWCLQVQKLLIKHRINTTNAADSDDSAAGSGSSSGSDDGGVGAAARRRRRRRAAAAAAAVADAGPRMPVSAERLRELYEQHQGGQQGGQQQQEGGDGAAAQQQQQEGGDGAAAQQQQQQDWLEAIAQELPVPASSGQVLLWLQQAGIVPSTAAAAVRGGGGGASGCKRLRKARKGEADQPHVNDELDDLLDDYLGGLDDTNKRGAATAAGGSGSGSGTKQGGATRLAAAAAAAAAGGSGGGGRVKPVPEPQPVQLLGYLQAMQVAHEESGRCVFVLISAFWAVTLARLLAARSPMQCRGCCASWAQPSRCRELCVHS
jgi:hypothetical protein